MYGVGFNRHYRLFNHKCTRCFKGKQNRKSDSSGKNIGTDKGAVWCCSNVYQDSKIKIFLVLKAQILEWICPSRKNNQVSGSNLWVKTDFFLHNNITLKWNVSQNAFDIKIYFRLLKFYPKIISRCIHSFNVQPC